MRYVLSAALFLQCLAAAAQPWITQVADLCPANNCNPYLSTPVECYNRLYFTADMGLGPRAYATIDGTPAGTYMLDSAQVTMGWGSYYTEYNSKVIFVAANATGASLFLADPLSNAVQSLFLPNASPFSGATRLTVYNGKVYFSAQDAANGLELWVTDGTDTGTRLLKDINPGANGSHPEDFVIMNNKLYFSANLDIYGRELWVTDGTDTGTHMVPQFSSGSGPSDLTVMNNQLYFACHMPGGWGLCTSDGTAAGTLPVKLGIGQPVNMMTDGNKLYFSAANNSSAELYVSDGTAAGTFMPKDINPGGDPKPLETPVAHNGKIYFIERSLSSDEEIWTTDGTTAGTVKIKGKYQDPRWLTSYCGKLYFVAQNVYKDDPQVWVYDGDTVVRVTPVINPPDTLKLDAVPPGIVGFVEFNGSLYYPADYDHTNVELWKLTDFPLGIAQNSLPQYEIFPNPAREKLVIEWKEHLKGELRIGNIHGQQMWQQSLGNGSNTIDISMLPSGMYIVQLREGSKMSMQKLVKE